MDDTEKILLYEIDKKLSVCAKQIDFIEEHMREQNGYIRENTEYRIRRGGELLSTDKVVAGVRNWVLAAVAVSAVIIALLDIWLSRGF